MATQAYYILDELLVGGEIQETSKKNIIRATAAQDMLQEVCTCTIYIYHQFALIIGALIILHEVQVISVMWSSENLYLVS